MSYEELLLENALMQFQHVIKRDKSLDEARVDFFTDEWNKTMSEKSLIALDKVWIMARYVTYTWCYGKKM